MKQETEHNSQKAFWPFQIWRQTIDTYHSMDYPTTGIGTSLAGDFLLCIAVLLLATLLGSVFSRLGYSEANIITVYIFGVLVISVLAEHQAFSLVSSIVSVMVFNFFFTEPKFTFMAYDNGDMITFFVMFLSAFMTGTLAAKLKMHARQSAETAYRTRILFDTSQLLNQAKGRQAIVAATAEQLHKLLNRDIVVYQNQANSLAEPEIFASHIDAVLISPNEQDLAKKAFLQQQQVVGLCLYLPVYINDNRFGVVGIDLRSGSLEAFENSVVLSILGECALALENEKNAREKEEAAVRAENEQLRANLLRAISHDLRTPLTSISGNASNLLNHAVEFDEKTKQQLYTDIYDDSQWLINLVENLLAVTRLEEGRMNLHLGAELIEEVINEALQHVNRVSVQHPIQVHCEDELLLAKMDAHLIVQVVINLVDNAIKYTPAGTAIEIQTYAKDDWVVVSVIDDGPGIPDENKEKVFEMFYCGSHQIADSRRSLGLGLFLCRSIIQAHGGTITVSDHQPHGAVFTFTLPKEEVMLHE